jgi:hypothetical protein
VLRLGCALTRATLVGVAERLDTECEMSPFRGATAGQWPGMAPLGWLTLHFRAGTAADVRPGSAGQFGHDQEWPHDQE